MQSLGFKIETSHSCQQRQHKTCRRVLSDCYFPVRRRGQDKREGIALWSLSGLLMHSCLLQGFFCLHCAWLGRRLLCYPLPLEATLQALLGVRCEGGQRLVCSSCTDQEGAGEERGLKSIWGWGKNPFPARSPGWGWSNFRLNIAPCTAWSWAPLAQWSTSQGKARWLVHAERQHEAVEKMGKNLAELPISWMPWRGHFTFLCHPLQLPLAFQ